MKLSDVERELFAWGACSAVVGLLLFVIRLRVQGSPLGLPLDDAWIHAAFASHLARFGQWGLFAGVPSGGESSPLWPWLLAPAELAGLRQAPRLALLWGSGFFVFLPGLVATLGSTSARRRALAVAIGLCGPLVFHALSGMETLPALTLGMAAIWRSQREDARGAALFAGAACWMRPDAWILLVLLLMVSARDARAHTQDGSYLPGVLARWLPGAVLGALALLALSAAEASFPPTTLAGRRWLLGLPPHFEMGLVGQGAGELLLQWLRSVGADFGLGRVIHDHPSALSTGLRWAWKTALLLALGAGLFTFARSAADRRSSGARLLLYWVLALLAFYALILPSRGHVGRYQVALYPLLILLAVEGVGWLGRSGRVRRGLSVAMAALLALGLVAGWVEVSGLWGDAIRHLDRVHLRAASELEAGLPEGAVLGVFDVGVVAYVYEGPMLDLSGLSDPTVTATLPHAADGAMAALMLRRGMTEVMLPVLNDQTELELAQRLGLLGSAARPGVLGYRAQLVEMGRWGSSPAQWGPAFHFSGNAFRQLRLYRWDSGS